MSVDNLPENDTTLSPAMRLWHALDRRRQLDESGKYCVGAAYDPEVRIIESHLTELEQLRGQLRKVCSEIDWFVSGGDDPTDRCSECGNPGYGMLRDARNDALRLLGREKENPVDP